MQLNRTQMASAVILALVGFNVNAADTTEVTTPP